MIRQETTRLENLPGEIVDVDIGPDGDWIAVCSAGNEFVVASTQGYFKAPGEMKSPSIRWMDYDHLVLIGHRTRAGQENARILSRDNEEIARFCAGDGIEDVLIAGQRIVVTYFDEGVFGGVEPSQEGIAVFSWEGVLQWGYQSGVRDPVDIADCYCACVLSPDEICFSAYTGFALVRLNLSTRAQKKFEIPEELAGAHGLASNGITTYFHSTYQARTGLFRWKPGEVATRIGTESRRLRGHRRDSFIAVEPGGYTLLYPES